MNNDSNPTVPSNEHRAGDHPTSGHPTNSYTAPLYGTAPEAGGSSNASVYGAPEPAAPSGYGYGQPAQTSPATALGTDATSRNWATAAHLSGFVAAWVALGFMGPLIVLLAAGSNSPFVRRHAVEALNFNLSVLIYLAISAVLMFVLVGFLLLPAVGLLYLVATISGAVAASNGRDFRYPLSIRFIS